MGESKLELFYAVSARLQAALSLQSCYLFPALFLYHHSMAQDGCCDVKDESLQPGLSLLSAVSV